MRNAFVFKAFRIFILELLTGFEPVTSSLPRTRSTNWAIAAYSIYYDIIVKKTSIVKLKTHDFEKFFKDFHKKYAETKLLRRISIKPYFLKSIYLLQAQ